MTTTGNAGVRFSLTDTATLETGSTVHVHSVDSAISELTIATTDVVASIDGTVGTTAKELDLNDLNDIDADGTSLSVIRNQGLDFTTIKQIVVHNNGDTNNIVLEEATSTSFLPSSEQITIIPGQAVTLTYSTAKTISTSGKIKITASGASSPVEIFILGT